MAMKEYEVYNPSDWLNVPELYRTDPDEYAVEIASAKKALVDSGFDMAIKWYAGEPIEADFIGGEGGDYDRLEGPHLKVCKNGSAILQWNTRDTDDEVWIELIEDEAD